MWCFGGKQGAGWGLLHEGADWSDFEAGSEGAATAPSGRFGMASAVSSVASGDEAAAEAGGIGIGMDALLVFGGWTLEWQGVNGLLDSFLIVSKEEASTTPCSRSAWRSHLRVKDSSLPLYGVYPNPRT